MSVYKCEVCNEDFCETCEPSLECKICDSTICPNCENESTSSDYLHTVICTSCFSSAAIDTQRDFKKNRNTSKPMTIDTSLKSKKFTLKRKISDKNINEQIDNYQRYGKNFKAAEPKSKEDGK